MKKPAAVTLKKSTSVSCRSLLTGAGLFALSLSAWAATSLFASGNKGRLVRVSNGDGIEYEFSLDDAQRFVVESSLGSNTIEIAEGQIRVVAASCPGKDCMHQAAIGSPGQNIVCLPNRLVIRIEEGNDNDNDNDKPDSRRDESHSKYPAVDGISG